MELSEAEVTSAFADWLSTDGWTVTPYEHDRWLDLYAERDDRRLLVEVKGKTSDPSTDCDTAYGQMLRRMPADDDLDARFALVVPALPTWERAVRRVAGRVREELRITVYTVDEHGRVARLDPA